MGLLNSGICRGSLYPLNALGGRRDRKQLVILMYHGVVRSPLKVYDWCFVLESSFRKQMRWLKRHFEVISLSNGVERLRNGEIRGPTAAISFDDGFQNNYDVVLPILRDAELPATIFPVTGLVDTEGTVWFGYINRALAETKKRHLDWDGCRFELTSLSAKASASSLIQKRLKRFPHEQLLIELRKILVELGDDPERPVEIGSPFRMLTSEAISEMDASGIIEFGAHTHSHGILSLLSCTERHEEIERSVASIGALTVRRCVLFAYPNGLAEDYDAETIKTLQACGIQASVTAIEGLNDGMTPLMELRRFGVGGDLSVGKFKREVVGSLTGSR